MKTSRDRWIENRYPLIEAGMSRRDCFLFIVGCPSLPAAANTDGGKYDNDWRLTASQPTLRATGPAKCYDHSQVTPRVFQTEQEVQSRI